MLGLALGQGRQTARSYQVVSPKVSSIRRARARLQINGLPAPSHSTFRLANPTTRHPGPRSSLITRPTARLVMNSFRSLRPSIESGIDNRPGATNGGPGECGLPVRIAEPNCLPGINNSLPLLRSGCEPMHAAGQTASLPIAAIRVSSDGHTRCSGSNRRRFGGGNPGVAQSARSNQGGHPGDDPSVLARPTLTIEVHRPGVVGTGIAQPACTVPRTVLRSPLTSGLLGHF